MKTNMKHTPGPWRNITKSCDIIGANRERVASVDPYKDDETIEANAALIAAAPELLSALRKIAAGVPYDSDGMTMEQMREAARAAIAKAEGVSK